MPLPTDPLHPGLPLDTEHRISVATWNCWSSPYRLEERLRAAAGELSGVDVVLLQESVPLHGASSASRIAELAGFDFLVEAGSGLSRCAVLSRFPLEDTVELPMSPPRPTGLDVPFLPAVSAGLTHPGSGRRLRVVSAHLAWGSLAEGVRLRQAVELAAHFDEAIGGDVSRTGDVVGVLGMDSNTFADSSTLRYLRGLDPVEGRSTWFLDTWSIAGDGAGATSTPKNPHAYRTAGEVGILRPEFLPDRRIDFLLVRGYSFGRPGQPLRARLLGTDPEFPPSDHYGILADLWLPPC